MTIEESIKQSKAFRDVHIKLLINILYTSSRVEMHQETFLKKFDLTSFQYNILRILRGNYPKGWTVGEVQKRMVFPNSNVTRIVDRLIPRNLVTRVENPANRREQILNITDEGLDLLTRIDAEYDEMMSVVRKLTDAEAETMNALLDKLRD